MPRKKSEPTPPPAIEPIAPIIKRQRRSKEDVAADKAVRAMTPAERVEAAAKHSAGTMPLTLVFYRPEHQVEANALIKKKKLDKLLTTKLELTVPPGVLV